MAHHHDQGHLEGGDGKFKAGDSIVEGAVAGDSYLEELTGADTEHPLRRHPGIGAAEQRGPGALALGQGLGIDVAAAIKDRLLDLHPLLRIAGLNAALPGLAEDPVALQQRCPGIPARAAGLELLA